MEKELITQYLNQCRTLKGLNAKTLKAYRIDLNQYARFMADADLMDRQRIIQYLSLLHEKYKPKTAKRKIASLKAFYHYLVYEEIIAFHPFTKIDTHFKEPLLLPRTIDLSDLSRLLGCVYQSHNTRDIAILEMLVTTGLRVSEIAKIKTSELGEDTLRIHGKGNKERIIFLEDTHLKTALVAYYHEYQTYIERSDYFFINRSHNPISEQSIRLMVKKYARNAGIDKNITPHMFRHTFATMLLEEDVDIRYIQHILGHSSIVTTQIYTHVVNEKQKKIMREKNPRKHIMTKNDNEYA